MFKRYLNFIRGVSVNKTGKAGVILTTSSFFSFIFFETARLTGVITNSYIGLITYLLFPSLFMFGLIFIPIGWKIYKTGRNKSTRELLKEQFPDEEVKARIFGSKLLLTVLFLTMINVVFLLAASTRMLHFMDEPKFCGTACHKVMNPEWVTYQDSPHAKVKCVECHVGEGTKSLISSKLNGLRQIYLASLNIYNKPIPTPVHRLRPARETCEKCHWPEKFYGSKLKTITHYETDSTSTLKYTTLNLKIDIQKQKSKSGIHWHISKNNKVRYTSLNDERKDLIWVEVKTSDGTFKKYLNKNFKDYKTQSEKIRTLDCIDCHNRATHIYKNPGDAIDQKIYSGKLERSLPYIKKVSFEAIYNNYPDKQSAEKGISNTVYNFYRKNYPFIFQSRKDEIESVVKTLRNIYYRNVHPYMNLEWNTYPDHIGHKRNLGCFRCHNSNMIDSEGEYISIDCTTCHSILADKEDEPFKYLKSPNKSERDYEKHKYLRQEFIKSKNQ